MSIHIGKDRLAPVIAVALDEAWGNRYGEDAAKELAPEGDYIANALLKEFSITLPEVGENGELADLSGLPVNTVISVVWKTSSEPEALRKTRDRTPGALDAHWEVLNENNGMVWAEWEIELVAHTVKIVALGTHHD